MTLPRSGYTEQPRVLTLGQVVRKRALPVRHSFALSSEGGKVAPYVGRAGRTKREQPEDGPGPPLVRNMVELPTAL